MAELKIKDEELDRKEGEIKEYTEMKMDMILIKERWRSIVKYLQEKNKGALLKEQELNKNLQVRIDRQCKMIGNLEKNIRKKIELIEKEGMAREKIEMEIANLQNETVKLQKKHDEENGSAKTEEQERNKKVDKVVQDNMALNEQVQWLKEELRKKERKIRKLMEEVETKKVVVEEEEKEEIENEEEMEKAETQKMELERQEKEVLFHLEEQNTLLRDELSYRKKRFISLQSY